MKKENLTQKALQKAFRQRNEVLDIIEKAFLEYETDEDNSWRVKHNYILLSLKLEPLLTDYFNQRSGKK